ncbi:hypothetical protein JRO89_XS05G0255400 [Xanthoceras sorbifolium]|uniref:Wall-associated receptor kinase galacturonan-binding domain-containing protein n=1 Tax=Xanthoceras sorbifolium TaxID=99658 RepID=A0ABQ8I3B9_9ROSI|nr:hypothetical protein JRO89_XS05G0255400 [Xanthoceras sorbifolium]
MDIWGGNHNRNIAFVEEILELAFVVSGMALASPLLLFVICYLFSSSMAEEVTGFNPRCTQFPCGNLGYLGFPFSNQSNPECGLFQVHNCNQLFRQKIQLWKDGPWFHIGDIKLDNTLQLRDHESENNNYNAKGHITIVVVDDSFSLIAAITATGISVLITLALCFRKRLSSVNFTVFWEKKCKDYLNIEAFLRNYGNHQRPYHQSSNSNSSFWNRRIDHYSSLLLQGKIIID